MQPPGRLANPIEESGANARVLASAISRSVGLDFSGQVSCILDKS